MTTHAKISYLKSAVRLLGYALLMPISMTASLVLIASEVIGIVEEFGL